jgi:hypothetical protein
MSSASKPNPRTPQELIDGAISENKKWDWLCFVLVCILSLLAIGGIVYGTIQNQWTAGVGAGVATLGFWPCLQYVREVRRENVALRVLEASLSDPKEAKATFETLRRVYVSRCKKGTS